MVMLKRIAILAILIPATMLLSYDHAEAATQFRDIVADAALLAELDTGTIIFEHNMRQRHPADALARIMTLSLAVTAIEDGEASPYDLIEMTETAWTDIGAGNTTLDIRPGEEMTLLDLMYSAFLTGAAEACNMIAEHIAGSIDAFVHMMNAHAVKLGCENTNFVNTHGQYHDDQYTSARDQFLIFSDAMGHELFIEIAGAFRHTTEATNASEQRRLTSSNSLLNQTGKYFYRHCVTGMASVTYEGGYSFVGFAEADGLALLAVVLGSDVIMFEDESAEMRNLTEARRLFEWGFSQFGWRTILATSDLIERVPVTHGAGADFVIVRPESSITLLLDNDIPLEEFVRTVTIYSEENDETLVAPIEAGEVLGEVTVTRDGVVYGTILLVANTDIELHRFEFIRIRLSGIMATTAARNVIIVLAAILVVYAALVIRYNVIRSKRMRRIKAAKRKIVEERQHSSNHHSDFD